jgi:hypothetical protein
MDPQEKETRPFSVKIEFFDPAPLRMHPLHKGMPTVQMDSIEWQAFVDGLSAVGPEGIPPIYVTAEGMIVDGERRWRAARQLQWSCIASVVRPEWEAATLMVESLLGQRSLTKGAKVYLSLGLYREFISGAETRRLANLKIGTRTLEKPLNLPKFAERTSGKGVDGLCEKLGCCRELYWQAVQIRKYFEMPGLVDHKFEFQDGREMTLKEYWEPIILDPEHPKGLGEVLKGIGYFVTPDGKPLNHPPPARNSDLFYFQHGWSTWSKQCSRWEGLSEAERAQAMEAMAQSVQEVPAEVLSVVGRLFKAEAKRRKKSEKRKTSKTERTDLPVGMVISVRYSCGTNVARCNGKTASCTMSMEAAAERVAMKVAGFESDYNKPGFVQFEKTGIRITEVARAINDACYLMEREEEKS